MGCVDPKQTRDEYALIGQVTYFVVRFVFFCNKFCEGYCKQLEPQYDLWHMVGTSQSVPDFATKDKVLGLEGWENHGNGVLLVGVACYDTDKYNM